MGKTPRVGSIHYLAASVLGGALGLMLVTATGAFSGRVTTPGSVQVSRSEWTFAWAPGEPRFNVSKGYFVGSCLNISGTYPPSSNASCSIDNADADQAAATVLFESVVVNSPFHAAFGPPLIGSCASCRYVTINITMPENPGDWPLDATVYLTT